MTDKPVISDAEVNEFCVLAGIVITPDVHRALSAFLLARVPEHQPEWMGNEADIRNCGFNACREQIMRGKE